eukprot:5553305-Amphidinium_carterae.3
MPVLRTVATAFANREMCVKLGFNAGAGEKGTPEEHNTVAQHAYELLHGCIGEFAVTSCSYTSEPPLAFQNLALLSPDTSVVERTKVYLQELYTALQNLEDQLGLSLAAASFHRDLKWARNEWCREMFLCLQLQKWQVVDHVRTEL